jgi:hypothetical protein
MRKSTKVLPELKIVGMGNKVFVHGERGKWEVMIVIRLADGRAPYVPVRINAQEYSFNTFEKRDQAREVQETLLATFAMRPDRPVYVSVFAPNATGGARPFINKDCAVVPLIAAHFEHVWKMPRSLGQITDLKAK